MRRVTLPIVLLIVLAACGRGGSPASVPTPASPSAPANAYPAPSSAPALPTQIPPTVASVPTLMPSPMADVKPLTVTKIQSLKLSYQAFGAVDLIGWSPDDRYFLYKRGDRYDQASHLLLGELYVVDTSTDEDIRIPLQDVILGIHSGDYIYELGTAYWSEQCCSILTSVFEQGKQAIERIDLNTNQVTHVKTTELAIFGYQGTAIGLVDRSGFTLDDKPISQQLLDATTWLTSTVLTQHGLYTHNGHDLRYISNSNNIWEIHGDSTFLKGSNSHTITWIASSPDDTMIALVSSNRGSKSRNLWLINRITNDYTLISQDLLAYPSWSPDGTVLMYRIYDHVIIIDFTTHKQTIAIDNPMIPVWHHTKLWFAMLDSDSTAIDIYTVSR